MRFRIFTVLVLALLCGAWALYSQEVVVPMTPSDGEAATMINAQIAADTVGHGFSADRVYEFQRGEIYLQNATLTVQAGRTIRFRASQGDGPLPVIYLWPTGSGSNPQRPPGWSITLNGGHAEVKDICMVGIYEYEPTAADNMQGGLIQTASSAGGSIILDGVIMSNTNGNHVRTNTSTLEVVATNCQFVNMGNLVTSNFGAGKAFDLRDVTCGSLVLVNNTFVNYQDRPIRHWNATSTQPIIQGLIDHNTFVNGMGFHGLLSLGGVGREMTITNNLFIDAFGLGEDSTDVTRIAEWANTGEFYANGNNKIQWIFTSPNDTTQWKVSNNFFAISDSGWAFLNDFGFGPADPLSGHIMSRPGVAADAFTYLEDLTPVNIPRLMTTLMRWYESPTGGNKTKDKANYVRARDDFDRRFVEYFRDTLDVSYPTTSLAYMGAEGGFPAGDLNWFPDKKMAWENQVSCTPIADVKVDANGDFVPDLLNQTVTICGIITTPNYSNRTQYYMQDETAGINLYSGALTTNLNMGDYVTVTGVIKHYNGLTEIEPTTAEDILVGGSRRIPDPMPITAADMGEATEGFLVKLFRYKIVDPAKWPAATKNSSGLYFTNGTDIVEVFIDKETDIDGTPAPTGWVDLIGVVDQYDRSVPPDSVYEIRPRSATDFVIITNVDGKDNNLPTDYALLQNHPNPFNPVTTIEFAAPEAGEVNIKVFDILGKEMATLHEGKLTAGYHKFQFNGLNLPSGVYFYRVESKHFVDVKKMTLVK